MVKKNITLDDLARMMQAGFKRTATKEEVKEVAQKMATKEELKELRMANKQDMEELARMVQVGFQETATKQYVDERFTLLADDIRILKDDVHDIKITLGPLVRTVAQMEDTLQSFHLRLSRLERKTGIAK